MATKKRREDDLKPFSDMFSRGIFPHFIRKFTKNVDKKWRFEILCVFLSKINTENSFRT